jgi:hypothetical protein
MRRLEHVGMRGRNAQTYGGDGRTAITSAQQGSTPRDFVWTLGEGGVIGAAEVYERVCVCTCGAAGEGGAGLAP